MNLPHAQAAAPLSPAIRALPGPPILECRRWGARYGGQAGPLMDLTQAVPGYPPHPGLLERLAEAAGSRAAAGYGPLEGEPALRDALAGDLRLAYGGDVQPEDVMVTAGCNLAFTLVMSVLAEPGDAVLVPTPWFFNHPLALALRGVTTVPLPCRAEDSFLPDPDQAAALLDRHTGIRALLLVTPNNPTGAAYPPALIARLAEICRTRRRWLVLDETYRDFLPDPPRPVAPRGEGGRRGGERTPAGVSLAQAPHGLFATPEWRGNVVHLYSFSKAYCIPGHRMGAVVAGPALREAVLKAVDNIQICPPRPPQLALAWAVEALRGWRAANRAAIAKRMDVFRQTIARHASGWHIDASGAYFAYLRTPEGSPPAAVVAERLAAERGLVTLPGSAFGPAQERHLRLAFAATEDDALKAVAERLRGAEV